jgi:hypothetical protein
MEHRMAGESDNLEVGRYGWNDDPAWVAFALGRYAGEVRAIARKYAPDESFVDDCMQEAWIHILRIVPQTLRAYERYAAGEISEEDWLRSLDSFVGQTVSNKVRSFLDSPKRGSWTVARTRKKRMPDGSIKRVRMEPRCVSLDEIEDSGRAQLDEKRTVVWDRTRSSAADREGRWPFDV